MTPQTISPDQILQLRSATQTLSQALFTRLRAHFDALAPLFRPRRFLGDYMEGIGKEAVTGAERNAKELQELYRKVAVKPFDLRPELSTPLESVPTQFRFHEWGYQHAMQTDRGWQSIHVTTPLTAVVAYDSPYSLTTLRDVLSGNAQRDPEAVRAFVVRACVMHEMFRKFPSITELLSALRYRVEVRKLPAFGELPLVTISTPFQTFRPPDNVVALAAGMAGGQSFAEILDVDSVRTFTDPVRDETIRILEQHKVEI
jgi:hypothetical protein